jgi:hypothetical protein
MTWKANVLVVANVTAASAELLAAMGERAARGPAAFTLVMPSTDAGAAARHRAAAALEAAVSAMRDRELEVDGVIGDADPFVAVLDIFDPRRHDEIIVSTLPAKTSHWLQIDLAQRLERATGVPVSHVEASVPREAPVVHAAPQTERQGVLEPLRVLAWGGPRRSGEDSGRAGHDQ